MMKILSSDQRSQIKIARFNADHAVPLALLVRTMQQQLRYQSELNRNKMKYIPIQFSSTRTSFCQRSHKITIIQPKLKGPKVEPTCQY